MNLSYKTTAQKLHNEHKKDDYNTEAHFLNDLQK